MTKIIHYCWFGDRPLSRLAKRCIKSWQKYLPDYEIMKWSEENVDLNEGAFIKEAYDKKKWAFVADYARTKALYEHGGIYFDTDMMITKDIKFLLDDDTFLGIEDSRMVNAAVWGEKKPKSDFTKQMLDFYKSQKHFNDRDIYSISIPRVITRILNQYDFNRNSNKIQILNKTIHVYPREYFYPLSYNYKNNLFTKNTCMVHYFDASWVSGNEKKAIKVYRAFGEKRGEQLINTYRFVKRNSIRALKIALFPAVLAKRSIDKIPYNKRIDEVVSKIESLKADYLVFHNPDWLGVTSATVELFDNRIPCEEILGKRNVKKVGNAILKSNTKQIIFSAMCIGWKDLAIYLKSKSDSIKVKIFWHGNHSQILEPYGWQRNIEIIELHKKGIIDVFGTCKESLLKFYETQGYKVHFIQNNVILDSKIKNKIEKLQSNIKDKNKKIKVGIYAAKSDDWRKNMFAQIAAVALLDNAQIDMVPLNNDAVMFANALNVTITGLEESVSRDKLLERMAQNDMNLYVTFSECSPMLPLESFEVGVPCITGNNHHYFKDNELGDYLVVNNEASPMEIAMQIKKCLDNEKRVKDIYYKWKKQIDIKSKEYIKEFLDM